MKKFRGGSNVEGKNRIPILLLSVVVLASLTIWLPGCGPGNPVRTRIVEAPVIENAEFVGQDTCAMCHEDSLASMAATVHGRLAEFETSATGFDMECETCHGAGSLHMDSEDPEDIIRPEELAAAEGSAICLKCHTDGSQMHWLGSAHDLSDVGCMECHEVHSAKAEHLLVKNDPDLCYLCHQEQQHMTLLPSHHPIPEGRMGCGDCHQVHGSIEDPLLATDERLNDMCLNCHSAYQGPFIFEHEPVLESCDICHEAHGSVANNLLIQNEPFLCLQCHDMHFHAGLAGDEGDFTTIYGRDGTSTLDAPKMTFLTKCTQCHTQVHGSDLPSQSITGPGALTR